MPLRLRRGTCPTGDRRARADGVQMLTLSRRTVVAGAMLGAAAIAIPVAMAGDGGIPANKAVAAGSKTEVFAPGDQVTLLTATFKTSKPEDLLMSLSMEC